MSANDTTKVDRCFSASSYFNTGHRRGVFFYLAVSYYLLLLLGFVSGLKQYQKPLKDDVDVSYPAKANCCKCGHSTGKSRKLIFLPSQLAKRLPSGEPDAIRVGDFVHISPQIGEDLATRTLVTNLTVFEKLERTINNSLLMLNYLGCTPKNRVNTIADFGAVLQEMNAYLPFLDKAFATFGLTLNFNDTIQAAATINHAEDFANRQNVTMSLRQTAYACNWTSLAQTDEELKEENCDCQHHYHHHAWDLPLNVSLPIPLTKGFRRVARGGNTVFITGNAPQDFLTGGLVAGGLAAQVNKSLDNLALQLAQAGCVFEDVTAVETLVTNLTLSSEIDQLYKAYFGNRHLAYSKLTGRKTLVTSNKIGALLVQIVQAADCAWTAPQYFVPGQF